MDGFPVLGVLRALRPAAAHQLAMNLPDPGLAGSQPTPGGTSDGSRVHLPPIDRIGTQLCPCTIAMVTPWAFTMASWPPTFFDLGVPRPDPQSPGRVRSATRPDIRQV